MSENKWRNKRPERLSGLGQHWLSLLDLAWELYTECELVAGDVLIHLLRLGMNKVKFFFHMRVNFAFQALSTEVCY